MVTASRAILGLGLRGFHRLAYTEWGAPESARTVICVHGLSRNGRDFDALAGALADRWRVICPDVVGRGGSDRLANPADYGYPQYMADMNALIARLDVETVDWVGTSMGGLIGMMLAAMPGSPIRRLVVNDVGPFIPKAALERIASYVGGDRRFDTIAGIEVYFREIYAGFGDLTDDEWRHLAEHGARPTDGGGYRLAYDPAIADAFKGAEIQDVDIWPVWDAIACPVLVIRGANSDVLLAETAAEMTRRGPKATLHTLDGAGHAPALMAPDQIALISDWLSHGHG